MVKRSNGNGQSGSAAGDFRPLSPQNNPVAANVVGTPYQVVPFLPTAKTGDIHFKWNSSTPLNSIPVITRVWLTADGGNNAVISNIKFGPPSVAVPSAPNYYIDYNFYNNNMPNAGRITLEFTNPQTGTPAFTCTYDLKANATAAAPVIDCTPTITQQPLNQVLCGAATASFTVGASGASTYQWQVSTDGTNFSNITNGGVYSGATSTKLVVANPATSNGKQFRAVVGATGCGNVTSNAARLVASTGPLAVFTGASAYCGASTTSLGIQFTGVPPYAVTYTVNGTPTSESNISSSPYYISVSPAGNSTVAITSVSDATCTNSIPSGNTAITFYNPPAVTPSNASTCVGSNSFALPYTLTGSANQYSIAAGTRAMPGFVPVVNATMATSPLSVAIPASGVAAGTYDFVMTVRNSTASCGSATVPFTVTVNSLPILSASASAASVCANAPVTLTAAPGTLTAYSWSANPVASIAAVSNPTVNPAVATTYTVTGTNANGCSGTASVSVGILSAPTLVISPAAPSLCNGISTTLTASGGNTYTWSPATGLSGTAGASVIATPATTTTYTVTSANSSGCSSVGTVTVTVVTPPISITNSSPHICSGGIATLTATAGFSTYQWFPIAGLYTNAAGTVAYTGTSVATVYAKPTTGTTYNVTGTTSAGCSNTASTSISIIASPVDAANSTGNFYTFCSTGSSPFPLKVNVTSTPISMEWSYATTEAGSYTPFSTSVAPAGATFVPSSTGPTNATVTVTPGNGSYSGPRFLKLTITTSTCVIPYNIQLFDTKGSGVSLPAPIVAQSSVCSGTGTTVTMGSLNPSLSVQWQTSTNNSTFTDITGATTTNYTTPNLSATTYYRAIFSGQGSCGYNTGAATITVVSPATGNTISSATSCTDGVNFITLNGSAIAGVTYQWQRSTTSATTGFTDLPGVTTQNYTLTRSLVPVTTWYVRNASNGNCFNNASAALAIYAPISNNTISSATSKFCGTSTATLLSGSIPAGGTGSYTYLWQLSTDNINWATATGTSNTINYTTPVLSSTTHYRRIVTSGGCANSTSTTHTITVNANPVITIANTGTSLCGGKTSLLTASGGNSYTWSPSTNLSATSGSSVLMSAPNATGSTSYSVTGTNSATGCSATSAATVINYTAPPATPTVSTTAATICSNASAYNLNAIVTSGGTYEWFTVPEASAGFVVSNPTAVSTARTYYLFAKNGSCYSTSFATFTLSVANVSAPVPNATAIAVCAPATINLVSLQPTAAAGTILEWHTGNTSASPLVSTPASVTNGTYYLFAYSSAGNCYGPASSAVTAVVNTLPVTTVSASPAAICAPGTFNLNIYNTTANGSNSYQWYSSNSSATPSNLVNIPAEVGVSGSYYLYATSATGCRGNASAAVNLIVNSNPTADIIAPAAVCPSNTISIAGASSASAPVYTWQVSNNAGLSYSNVANTGIYSGAASNSLGIANSTGLDGYLYRYVVASSTGCNATSNSVIVNVDGVATITTQPSNYAATANSSALFKISTSGSPTVNYQWKVSTNGGGSYTAITDGATYKGTNTPDLVITSVAAGFNGYRYLCEISNTCTSVIASSAAVLTVSTCVTASVGGNVAGSTSVCTGTNTANLTLSGFTGTILRWESSTDNFTTDGTVINNTTTNLSATNLTTTTRYRAVVQSGSCAIAYSATATVTVNANGAWIGGPTGDWNNPANWCGGVPTTPSNVDIPAGSVVTISSGTSYATSVNIAAGAQLVMSGTGNLSLSPGATFTNNGTFNATASTTGQVLFTGAGTISGTITFKNIATAGALNFGTASTIAGNFTLQPGGSVAVNAPYYTCPGATLIYAGGSTFSRGLEWTSASTGAGYPSNVQVTNNTVINFPIVGAGFVCNDLMIDAGSALNQNFNSGSAPLTVARDVNISGALSLGGLPGGDITLGRNWTRATGAVFNHNNRSVYFTGSSNAVITAPATPGSRNTYGAFGGETFYRMFMNKQTLSTSVSLGAPLTIVKELGFVQGTFNVDHDVTLVSNDTVTASIAPMATSGGSLSTVAIQYPGTGKFSIQRRLTIGASAASRRWRLISTPIQSTGAPTISDAWQYGVSNSDRNSPINPWPGFGTTITKSTTYNAADGFDQGSTNNPSLYFPGSAAGAFAWQALPSTKIPVTNYEAYFLFARGSRDIVVSTPNINANPTTLEARGRINTGDVQKAIAAGYQVFGNPYASAINFGAINFAGYASGSNTFTTKASLPAGVGLTYYVWDPKTSGNSNVGKWITCSSNGDGTYAVTGNSSGLPTNGTLESGSAFMLNADAAGGTLTFHENDKVSGSSNIGMASRETNVAEKVATISTNLMVGTGSGAALSEGVINAYHSSYRNQVDGQDATGVASFNSSDALRIASSQKQLVVERRNALTANDTIFLQLVNVSQKQYGLQFSTRNIDAGMIAVLEDKFKGSATPISLTDTSYIPFEVTAAAGSAAADRFRIVFKTTGVLPVTFKTIKAVRQQANIAVEWEVENEENVNRYTLERSQDGRTFKQVYSVKANGNRSGLSMYKWLDVNMPDGDYYYRVKRIDTDNSFDYSRIVKVATSSHKGTVAVYPNPVRSSTIAIQLSNMPAANYQFNVVNSVGQVVFSTNRKHSGGNASINLSPGAKLAAGQYQVQVLDGASFRQVIAVMVAD